MRGKNTLSSSGSKLRTVSESGETALDPLDIDRFLASGPYRFWDPDLDAPPDVKEVATLVRLGLPAPYLVNRGTVREASALLDARRKRVLASIGQARLLRDRGHPRPWSIRFVDVAGELRWLRERGERCYEYYRQRREGRAGKASGNFYPTKRGRPNGTIPRYSPRDGWRTRVVRSALTHRKAVAAALASRNARNVGGQSARISGALKKRPGRGNEPRPGPKKHQLTISFL